MKNQTLKINSPLMQKANGTFFVYNTTENMAHMVKVNKDGKPAAINAKNLINIAIDCLKQGIELGNVIVL